MKDRSEWVQFMVRARGARHMTRFQNTPRVTDNNVAEHSYYVVLYTLALCDMLGIGYDETGFALELAAMHDIHEGIGVEIPANVKRVTKRASKAIEDRAIEEMSGKLKRFNSPADYEFSTEVTDKLHAILKLADLIDALIYCVEELRLGNAFFKPHVREIKQSVTDKALEVMALAKCEHDDMLSVLRMLYKRLGIDGVMGVKPNLDSMTHICEGFTE